jgi:hypothetical protein
VSNSGSLGELAEALFHRKAPEALFMIVTAYIDESGTHEPSPASVMAGYLAEARQWRKFEKRAAKCLSRYRVNICHAIDLKRGDNDFRGWSVDKKLAFIDDLQHIMNETLECGHLVVLKSDDYDIFYGNRERPKKVIRDTKYGVLFRSIVACFVKHIAQTERWQQKVKGFQIVLESGHPNSGDAVRLFEFARSQLGNRSAGLAGVSFKPKLDCLPLAAADLLAYGAYVTETGGKRIGTPKLPLKSLFSYRRNGYRHIVTQKGLEALYHQSLQLHDRRQNFGRRISLPSVSGS